MEFSKGLCNCWTNHVEQGVLYYRLGMDYILNMMKGEMEAIAKLDPDCETFEVVIVIQESNTDEGYYGLNKVGLNTNLWDPGLNVRKVDCVDIMLMKWMMVISIHILTLKCQESSHGILG